MKKLFAILLISALLCALPALCEAGTGIPDELVGQWKGQGAPKYGGIASIDLTVTMDADGTGSGEFTYSEGSFSADHPFSISYNGSTFSVDIPSDTNIAGCEAAWTLKDGALLLDITATLESGTSYYYTAECERIDAAEGGDAEA